MSTDPGDEHQQNDIVTRLRGLWNDNDCASTLMDQAADEIERLRAERDEARREVCELLYNRQGGWPKEHAIERGWNCFKDGT